jgi:hypothetical protein
MLSPGMVIELADPYVRPRNKPKWHICICPEKKLFLRINSRRFWPPWHFLEAAKNSFLDHDSYVELTQPHFLSDAWNGREIGALSPEEALALAETAQHAPTLTQEQKDLVWERLHHL